MANWTGAIACALLALTVTPGCVTGDFDTRFTDRAVNWGLADPAKRAVWGDLDGDGWLDCVLDGSRVYLNRARADGTAGRRFVDHTAASGINARFPRDERARLVILGDVDGDGDLDLYSACYNAPQQWAKGPEGEPLVDGNGARVPQTPDQGLRSAILLNDGQARFTVLPDSGVGTHAETTSAATFLDYDLDGHLDLFVGNWYRSYGWSVDAYPDRLLRGRGDGRFEEVTGAAGLMTRDEAGHRDSSRPTYGVTAGDWNDDGHPDLFVCAYGRQWNFLWQNNGDGTFTEVGERTGFDGDANRSGHYPGFLRGRRDRELPFRSNGNTFDCALWDYDGDGDLDAFLAEITHYWAGSSSDPSTLLVNLGDAEGYRFDRQAALITRRHDVDTWNQGDIHAGWIDGDGDGRIDLLIASSDYPDNQRLRAFRQSGENRFTEVTSDWGLDWEGSGGLSVGDADGDGDPDILIGRSLARLGKEKRAELGQRPGLWLHPGGQGPWTRIRLRGRGAGWSNSMGIGCRVTVEARGVTQVAEIQGGAGHAGHQNPPELYFAAPGADRIQRLTVRWADARHSISLFTDVPTGRLITIQEGEPAPRIEPLSP